MFRSLLISWAVMAVAFAITAWLISGVDVSGGIGSYLWIALIFGIVNAIIGTVVRLLTLPLTVITLGLFSIVINALLLEITDSLTDRLTIDDFFWTAIWAAVTLALVSVCLSLILGAVNKPRRA
jgi:putative membrane protein